MSGLSIDDLKIQILENIRIINDYPKKGIKFRDITTLLQHKDLFFALIEVLKNRYEKYEVDFVAGIESRGFIFGSPLAYALKKGFVPIRKKGKLPYKVFQKEYLLEYGSDTLEIHQDAFCGVLNPKVLLIDDLIATGGTAKASEELIMQAGGECIEACFLMDLKMLSQDVKLKANVFSVLELWD
ncbi:adenine phosphoribosyltransferase [Helicobacter anatolicus]|uniref:adenine phosphoribosyltransferase n=1 Tax=Helicobacter anatolicus TaxID=2905874 RepID=UPI001E41E213|nr:adenine phosphoribosyltransferase [Helicobacter anatolicus]MCE3039391.1 adenine phosphoribosyltransferase [Helicobacter anatolicus]